MTLSPIVLYGLLFIGMGAFLFRISLQHRPLSRVHALLSAVTYGCVAFVCDQLSNDLDPRAPGWLLATESLISFLCWTAFALAVLGALLPRRPRRA